MLQKLPRRKAIHTRAIPALIAVSRLPFWIALIVCVDLVPTRVIAAEEATSRLECNIRSEPRGDFLQLTASVRSKDPVSGEYNLVVSKHSETGTSDNAQSGAFELTSEREHVLTTTLLDHSAVGHYRARLSIKTPIGRVSCSSP